MKLIKKRVKIFISSKAQFLKLILLSFCVIVGCSNKRESVNKENTIIDFLPKHQKKLSEDIKFENNFIPKKTTSDGPNRYGDYTLYLKYAKKNVIINGIKYYPVGWLKLNKNGFVDQGILGQDFKINDIEFKKGDLIGFDLFGELKLADIDIKQYQKNERLNVTNCLNNQKDIDFYQENLPILDIELSDGYVHSCSLKKKITLNGIKLLPYTQVYMNKYSDGLVRPEKLVFGRGQAFEGRIIEPGGILHYCWKEDAPKGKQYFATDLIIRKEPHLFMDEVDCNEYWKN